MHISQRQQLIERYRIAFKRLIADSLERVIGKPLQSVTHYVLQQDYNGFDADKPNTSGGCQGIHVSFAGGEVELDWDWEDEFNPAPDDLTSEPTAYHIVAHPTSMRRAAVCIPTDDENNCGLAAIDATKAQPWKDIGEQLLKGVDVLGLPLPDGRYTPQAVRLSFSSAQIIICIGISASMSIGDGGEVLILTEHEWAQKLSEHPYGWLVNFWSSTMR